MIHLTSANYEDPQESPNCQLLLRIMCEPHPTNGETAIDNAQMFVSRVKLLAETPLAHGQLALDSDGHLLSRDTLQYMILTAEERGAMNVRAARSKPRPKKLATRRRLRKPAKKRKGKSRK